jgi:hypothetical protein
LDAIIQRIESPAQHKTKHPQKFQILKFQAKCTLFS